ncbi:MAG: hypothetical protein NXI20_07955 [bacterium]|nr:hypothetical protein [bacterium]
MLRNKLVIIFSFLFLSTGLFAQDDEKNIVEIIDDLTSNWDETAVLLDSYDGLKNYCKNRVVRNEMIDLLNQIHHYDTVLYNIVIHKYNTEKNKEAKATIDDINTVEVDYTTISFIKFLRTECGQFNDIEKNYSREGGDTYQEEIDRLEAELDKYIVNITKRIDIIDEHVHHLKGLKKN